MCCGADAQNRNQQAGSPLGSTPPILTPRPSFLHHNTCTITHSTPLLYPSTTRPLSTMEAALRVADTIKSFRVRVPRRVPGVRPLKLCRASRKPASAPCARRMSSSTRTASRARLTSTPPSRCAFLSLLCSPSASRPPREPRAARHRSRTSRPAADIVQHPLLLRCVPSRSRYTRLRLDADAEQATTGSSSPCWPSMPCERSIRPRALARRG